MNSDRCGIRGDRLCSPLATTSATSLTRCGFATAPLPAVTNYLRVSISACLTDTSGEPTVSVRSNSNATRNLRLLFRLVNAGSLRSKLQSRRSHTVSHVPPTHGGSCRLHSTPSALTPPQYPDGRCADALTPLRQRWRPLRSLRAASGARHGGVGKLSNRKRILEIACRSTSYATPLCAVCSKLPALLRPRSPPLRATSSSPPIATSTPRLDRCICVKGERCCRMR